LSEKYHEYTFTRGTIDGYVLDSRSSLDYLDSLPSLISTDERLSGGGGGGGGGEPLLSLIVELLPKRISYYSTRLEGVNGY
jgi:hypothetical protein